MFSKYSQEPKITLLILAEYFKYCRIIASVKSSGATYVFASLSLIIESASVGVEKKKGGGGHVHLKTNSGQWTTLP